MVVGINRYRKLEQLGKPADDAEAIAQLLETYGEFKITRLPEGITREGRLIVDPTRDVSTAALKKALADLARPAGQDFPDVALFFFAGHGLREQIGLQEGYLAASDSDPGAERWGLSLSWLQRLLKNSPVRSQIVWLDCCYSGEFLNLSTADPGGLNRCFIAASRSFEAAYEQIEGAHGVLTGALLQGLAPEHQADGRVTQFTLADSVNKALAKESQHPVCNNSGEPIALTRMPVAEVQASKRSDICPYKGLEFFDCNETDPEYFFGRNSLVDQLLERIRSGNFAAVTGVSGSGKSSVVRAGLLHQLKRGQRLAGSYTWPLAVMLPGEHPLESLVEVFRHSPRTRLGDLAALLETGSGDSLSSIVDCVVGDGRLILVIDQFEEVFTRCQDEAEREGFLGCLLGALETTASRLTVVVTLRADFFSKCAERAYAGLAQRIQDSLITVLPMSTRELRAAVVEPAHKVGLAVDEDLVSEVIAALHREPANLPLLEYTLTELWKRCHAHGRLTLKEYVRLGGVQGALEQRAEAVYGNLSPEEQQAAKWIFLELTQLGEGTEDTRRRQPKGALLATQRSPAVTESTLEKLTEARLLVKGKVQAGSQTLTAEVDVVDVAHESLIRSWPRLRRWIDENRDFQLWRLRLREAALEWTQKADKELLLRGARLLEAEARSAEYQSALSGAETGFIAASVAQRSEEERIRDSQRQALDEQRNRALRMQSLFLADLARQQNDRYDYCAGLLLALEALPRDLGSTERPFVAQAYKELYRSAVNLQRHMDLHGPQGGLIDAAFSPDGRWLVTTCNNGSSLVWELATGTVLSCLTGHADGVDCAVFSPDGRRLVTSSFDATARLWDTHTWSLLAVLDQHEYSINACAFSADGGRLLTASSDCTARIWDVNRLGARTVLEGHSGVVFAAAFSPNDQLVATASKDRTVRLWAADTGDCLAVLRGHADSVFTIAFAPEGEELLSASADGTARLWATAGGAEVALFKGHQDSINVAAFSPSGHRIVTASQDGTARLWERGTRKALAVLAGHDGGIFDAKFHPDGRLLITAGQDGTTRLWETGRGELLTVLTGAKDRINAATFDPVHGRVAAVSQDSSLRVWEIDEREQLGILWGHQSGVYAVAFHPDGRRIATGSQDRMAYLWDAETGEVLNAFEGHRSSVYCVAFSPDGQCLVTASRDGTARIWNVENGCLLKILNYHEDSVFTAAYSPDGRLIVTASWDGTARVWDAEDGTPIVSLAGHRGGVSYAGFSPDGRFVVTASQEGKVRFWEMLAKPTCELLKAHQTGINAAVFSPNGRQFATVSNDSTIRLWDTAHRRVQAELGGHEGVVYSAAFSPDGKRLVTASADCTARLWDTDKSEELAVLKNHKDSVNSVAFSPNGKRIVTASHDRSVRVWRALPAGQDLVDHARMIAPRRLTADERRRYFIE
ncbi:MAG: caspase family protein [Chromatiaceae bacterium]